MREEKEYGRDRRWTIRGPFELTDYNGIPRFPAVESRSCGIDEDEGLA